VRHFLVYVDDSGNEDVGLLFTAVVVAADAWAGVLRYWKQTRREFADDPELRLPTSFELHSLPFLGRRPLKEYRKRVERRSAVIDTSLPEDPHLAGVVTARAQVELADLALQTAMRAAATAGRSVREIAVVVDGTPSARTLYYRTAHRALDLGQRRIVEDEVIRDSRESHFIQMADICAHCAHALLKGRPGRYLRLAPIVCTATGRPATAEDPGFY